MIPRSVSPRARVTVWRVSSAFSRETRRLFKYSRVISHLFLDSVIHRVYVRDIGICHSLHERVKHSTVFILYANLDLSCTSNVPSMHFNDPRLTQFRTGILF